MKNGFLKSGTEFAYTYAMAIGRKKILIVDEAGFSRICSAILEKEGYSTNAVSDVQQIGSTVNFSDIGLVITSYPYGAMLFEELTLKKVPTMILSDHLCRDLVLTLDRFDRSLSHCMIKPLDYAKFRTVVNKVMSSNGTFAD